MLVKNLFRLFERGAHGHGDEVLLGHHLVDRDIEAGFKAQVAVGENADQLSVLGDGHAGDFVLAHDFERVRDPVGGMHGHRVDDHAAFRALHLVHFVGLLLDRQVAMNNAQAALLRQRDRHMRFRDGVHGGAHDRDVQADGARELRLRAGARRDHVRASGQQKDVIESKSFGNGKVNHSFSLESPSRVGVSLHFRERRRIEANGMGKDDECKRDLTSLVDPAPGRPECPPAPHVTGITDECRFPA
ncbi:hypothetical protein SBA1_100024 [Candidatus Sulfotelmatobacter kueseliae]|uniref:Uncharacterized protein n=1 Tax=Candidatus Sulfotelmatobacter kueseliae TaxID=2042962 RepID=A0A2U3JW51_9BACT|nr:hypothetical protein SBA1_100024 [Candidatus Sulfotelmatobacter kueseliae]